MDAQFTTDDLLQAAREMGLKGKDIAKLLGIAPSAVTALYKGTRQLKFDEAMKLVNLVTDNKMRQVPLIDIAQTGQWERAAKVTKEAINLTPEIDVPGTFAVTVLGDFANRILPEGAHAIIDTSQTELFSGHIYLLADNQGSGLIMAYENDPARFEPRSSNASYSAVSVGSGKLQVIGRVTGALAKF